MGLSVSRSSGESAIVAANVPVRGGFALGADGVRALACLMVMFHHFSQRLAFPAQTGTVQDLQLFFMTGNSGVSVFFVLSGFLLAWPFWRRFFDGGGFPDLTVFAKRRAARIVPGFYVNLAVCFVLTLVFVQDAPQPGIRFLAGLTFTAGFNWLSFFPTEINGPLWSIGFEVVSYVLLPLFMLPMFALLGKKRTFGVGLAWWIFVWLVVMGANQLIQIFGQTDAYRKGWDYGLVGGAKSWWPNYNPVGFFGHYSLGVIAAGATVRLGRSGLRERLSRRGVFDAIAAAAVLAVLVLLWSVRKLPEFSLSLQGQPYYFPLFPFLIAVILATLPHSRILGRLFDNPFARYTAKISFGLYIWHYLILELIRMFLVPKFHYFGIVSLTDHLALCGAVMVAAYAVASLSWFLLEKPVLAWVHARTALSEPDAVKKATIYGRPFVRASLVVLLVALVAVPIVTYLSSPRQPANLTAESVGRGVQALGS